MNADPQELAKFSELAHRWWDPESEFRPLHQINPLRLDWVDGISPLKGRRALDVGCGGGILSEAMARRGARVLGIDLATRPLKVAQLHAMESGAEGLEYREIAVEALATEQPGAFDVVTCMEMLEHVPDPSSVVAACARLAKPGGRVYFSTLNRNPKSFFFAIVGAEYVLDLLPRGTHEYARFIRPSELARWCRQSGLEVTHTRGLQYRPFHPALRDVSRHERQLPVRMQSPMRTRFHARVVLFDLDGTLADTAPDLGGAVNRMRLRRGLDALPIEQLRPVASSGAWGMLAAGLGKTASDADYEALREEFLTEYEGALDVESRLFEGVPSLLDSLDRHGVRWGIVTNKATRFTGPVVTGLGLGRAAVVIAGDTTAHAKPHPAPLWAACERLGAPAAECIYVGDDLRDVLAAHAAGMPAVAAAYGYLGTDGDFRAWGADATVSSPLDVLPLIGLS